LKALIFKNNQKKFLKRLKSSANWKNPKTFNKNFRIITYFLKKGSSVIIERKNFNQNILWKFMKPLKYYFLRMRIRSTKLKEIEMRSISNKWHIERKSISN